MSFDPIKDIPASKVGQVVQDFVSSGAKEVRAFENDDGTWTVSAS